MYAGELIALSVEDNSNCFFRFIALIGSNSSISLILTNFAFSLPFQLKPRLHNCVLQWSCSIYLLHFWSELHILEGARLDRWTCCLSCFLFFWVVFFFHTLFVVKLNKFANYCWQLKLVSRIGDNVTCFDTVFCNFDPQEFLKKFRAVHYKLVEHRRAD